jgi:hypothetical protein
VNRCSLKINSWAFLKSPGKKKMKELKRKREVKEKGENEEKGEKKRKKNELSSCPICLERMGEGK